jgi:hypothetical protein
MAAAGKQKCCARVLEYLWKSFRIQSDWIEIASQNLVTSWVVEDFLFANCWNILDSLLANGAPWEQICPLLENKGFNGIENVICNQDFKCWVQGFIEKVISNGRTDVFAWFCDSNFRLLDNSGLFFERNHLETLIKECSSPQKENLQEVVMCFDEKTKISSQLYQSCGYHHRLRESKAELKEIQEYESNFFATLQNIPSRVLELFPKSQGSFNQKFHYEDVLLYAGSHSKPEILNWMLNERCHKIEVPKSIYNALSFGISHNSVVSSRFLLDWLHSNGFSCNVSLNDDGELSLSTPLYKAIIQYRGCWLNGFSGEFDIEKANYAKETLLMVLSHPSIDIHDDRETPLDNLLDFYQHSCQISSEADVFAKEWNWMLQHMLSTGINFSDHENAFHLLIDKFGFLLWPTVRVLSLEKLMCIQDFHPSFDQCHCPLSPKDDKREKRIEQAAVLKELEKLKVEQSNVMNE